MIIDALLESVQPRPSQLISPVRSQKEATKPRLACTLCRKRRALYPTHDTRMSTTLRAIFRPCDAKWSSTIDIVRVGFVAMRIQAADRSWSLVLSSVGFTRYYRFPTAVLVAVNPKNRLYCLCLKHLIWLIPIVPGDDYPVG